MHAILAQFTNMNLTDPSAALQLAPGTMHDYEALAEHHYRAARPATATRVLTLRDPRPDAADRFADRTPSGRVVGVLVESLPSLSCRLREYALGDRYAAIGDAAARARVLNAEVRCISRVVVHPQWRGLGLAVRLVRAALDTATTPITEALAAMGKVHPFFAQAGMTAYQRPPHDSDRRLADALTTAGVDPIELADLEHAMQVLDALPGARRAWIHREALRWLARTTRTRPTADMPLIDVLRQARQRLHCEPVYFLHRNPGATDEHR